MNERDDAGDWTRGDWARWYLAHDDAETAAFELSAGDDLALAEADFPELARALHRRGLVALYEDGWTFVYTPQDAIEVLSEIERDTIASGGRLPPARSPAPARTRLPAARAPKHAAAATGVAHAGRRGR